MKENLKHYYDCKEYLESFEFDEFNGYDFYRYVFPNCENEKEMNFDFSKPNPVFLYKDDSGKIKRRIILNDTFENDFMDFVERNDFALCSGLSYRGRTNRLEHAQHLNALIFDLDAVELFNIGSLFYSINKSKRIPCPTFLVLSGTGLHLYYVLDKPVELFPNIKLQLKALKYDLTFKIWYYKATSMEQNIQYQSINQSFRMVGSINKKHNNVVRAYKIGDRVSLEHLNSFAEVKNRVDVLKRFRPSKYSLNEAKVKFPVWYQEVILNGERGKRKWHINRAVYDWWKSKIRQAEGGHRYFYLMCLAIYAYKCDITKTELKKDMLEAFEYLRDNVEHTNELTKSDVISALESYDKGLYNFTIKDIEYLTKIRIDRNRRNYREQSEHLKLARFARDLGHPNGEWRKGNGRPSKEKEILEWQRLNPNGTKAQCHKDTKIDPKTIRKFWKI